MRTRTTKKLLWMLGVASVVALGAAVLPASCADTAGDCMLLGLGQAADGGCVATGPGGAGGTGGTHGTGGAHGTGGTGGAKDGGPDSGQDAGDAGETDGGEIDGGAAPVCNLKLWSDPAAGGQPGIGIASDPQGVTMAGEFFGSISLGGAQLVGSPDGSMFVGRFNPTTLHPSWTLGFGSATPTGACTMTAMNGTANYLTMAGDAAGDVVLVGTFSGCIDFGCTSPGDGGASAPLFSSMGNFFVVGLDSAGACGFEAQFTDDILAQPGPSVAISPGGLPVLAGVVAGSVGAPVFGQTATLTSSQEIFVVELSRGFGHSGNPSADASIAWSRVYAGGANLVSGVQVDGAGNTVFAGTFTGSSLDFGAGSGPLASPGNGSDTGVFAASLDSSGNANWQTSLPSAGTTGVGVVLLTPGAADGGAGLVAVGGTTQVADAGSTFSLAALDGNGLGMGTYTVKLDAGGVPTMAAGSNRTVALVGSAASGLYLATIDTSTDAGATLYPTLPGSGVQATGAAFTSPTTLVAGGYLLGSLDTVDGGMESTDAGVAFLLGMCGL
jgi:hypothetical protein